MKKLLIAIVFALSIGLLPVVAQDTPTPDFATLEATAVETVAPSPEPTLDVTSTPTPAPPVDLPDDAIVTNGLQLILLLVLAAFGGGGIVAILTRFLESKEARDLGEKLYLAMPPEQQKWMRERLVEAEETNQRLLDYLKSISDGQPNTEPPNPFRGDVTRPPTDTLPHG